MTWRGIRNRDVVLIQRLEFPYAENGRIVVIERLGEEEGMGAWALKKLVFAKSRSSRRNEFEEELDFENPSVILRSHNPEFGPRVLDPSGRYHVRGVLLRSLPSDEVRLVDSSVLRETVSDES